MPVDVLLVGNNRSDVLLIKNVVAERENQGAKDTQTAAVLLFDPGFRPQLVMTDMHMTPGIDPELFQPAKAKAVPLVVFSSVLSPLEIAEVIRLGVKE